MKHLGIKEKEGLPDYEKFQELLKVFDQPVPSGNQESAS
jgi:hypothetical protein